MNNIDLINMIGQIDGRLKRVVARMIILFPDFFFGRVDLTFYTIDRNNFPGSPVGLNWEMDIKDKDREEYFVFEFTNESDLWFLNGYVSKHKDLELIATFVEIEEKRILDILPKIEESLNEFEQSCLAYLESNYRK